MAGVYRLLRPLLFALPAEVAHEATLVLAGRVAWSSPLLRALQGLRAPLDPRLATQAFGLAFPSPFGVAAGLDKDAVALPFWPALGFGHVEIGTVTPRPQPGNPRPRMVRSVPDRAIVNALGFPSGGAAAVAARLQAWRDAGAWPQVPVGANIGKNTDTTLAQAAEDYRSVAQALAPQVDWLTINVSSPNTPGLRDLQQSDLVTEILTAVREVAPARPLLVKFAPDLRPSKLRSLAAAASEAGAAGIVVTNTTLSRAGMRADPGRPGGLSGRPLRPLARRALQAVREGCDLPLVAVGGIDDAQEAAARLAAGATLLQAYTGLVFEGPALPQRIAQGLAAARMRPEAAGQDSGGDAVPAPGSHNGS